MKQLLMIALTTMLTGCVIAVNTDDGENSDAWYVQQKQNDSRIERLELGQSESSVRNELGNPDFHESFVRDGEEFVALFYRTRHVESDGVTTKDETTPVVFVDGELVGWGQSALENATAN